MFDCNNKKLLANITRDYSAAALSISPDGRQIATGFETFELWTQSAAGAFELTSNVKLVNPSRPDAKLWCLQAAAYSPSQSSAPKFTVVIGAFDCYSAQQNFLAAYVTDASDGSGTAVLRSLSSLHCAYIAIVLHPVTLVISVNTLALLLSRHAQLFNPPRLILHHLLFPIWQLCRSRILGQHERGKPHCQRLCCAIWQACWFIQYPRLRVRHRS